MTAIDAIGPHEVLIRNELECRSFPNDRNRTSRRGGRRYLLWLGRIAAAIGALLLIGAVYESMAEASDAKTYPPPGQIGILTRAVM